jgi:hypothetical protein
MFNDISDVVHLGCATVSDVVRVVLPKDHNADNEHRVPQSVSHLVLFVYMIIPLHCRGFLFQVFKSDKISLFALIIKGFKYDLIT